MIDQKFIFYDTNSSYFGGEIKDGCLKMESDILGVESGTGGEKHYSFSKEETDKLFSIVSFEEFKAICKKRRVRGLEKFLEENEINYETFFW